MPDARETIVQQVTLGDLKEGDVVWAEDGFWPVVEAGQYTEYVGYTVLGTERRRRLTGVAMNPILRVVA